MRACEFQCLKFCQISKAKVLLFKLYFVPLWRFRGINTYKNLLVTLIMKDRIIALMRHMGMSQKNFAEEICISPGTLSSIFSGRNNASLNTLNNIHERFPEVNMDWLMNGNGEMFVSGTSVSMQTEAGESGSSATSSSVSGIPVQPGLIEHLSGAGQMSPQTPLSASEGKRFDKPSRKIAEIRVFYDDGTFETFCAK